MWRIKSLTIYPGIHRTQHTFCFSLQVQSRQYFLLLHDISTEDTHLKPEFRLFPPLVSAVLTFLLHVVWAITFPKLLRAAFRTQWHHPPGTRQGVNSLCLIVKNYLWPNFTFYSSDPDLRIWSSPWSPSSCWHVWAKSRSFFKVQWLFLP